MAMQAATVEILIEKAKFEPRVAVAVAEVMDEAIENKARQSQLVTVPVLDARLTELKSELKGEIHGLRVELMGEIHGLRGEMLGIEGRVTRQVYVAVLGQMAVLLGIAYFFATHVIR